MNWLWKLKPTEPSSKKTACPIQLLTLVLTTVTPTSLTLTLTTLTLTSLLKIKTNLCSIPIATRPLGVVVIVMLKRN